LVNAIKIVMIRSDRIKQRLLCII